LLPPAHLVPAETVGEHERRAYAADFVINEGVRTFEVRHRLRVYARRFPFETPGLWLNEYVL